MISDEKEYLNRYDAGQTAVNRGQWRLAYDCFNDCLEYLKYYEPWRETDIDLLKKLVSDCNAMFK
jgi:hypothetical protein